ncbi:MAG: S8 family serine peptidase, partial [Acidobacteriota bacterium]
MNSSPLAPFPTHSLASIVIALVLAAFLWSGPLPAEENPAIHSVIVQGLSEAQLGELAELLEIESTHRLGVIRAVAFAVPGSKLGDLERSVVARGGRLFRTGAVRTSSATVEVLRDDFESSSFKGSVGSRAWLAPWEENDPPVGDDDDDDDDDDDERSRPGPADGQVRVVGGALVLDDAPNTGGSPSATRRADLAGATAVTLSFDFETTSGVDTSDEVSVEVSSDGSHFVVLEALRGFDGSASETRTYDLSGYASSETAIRFRVTSKYGGSNEFFRVTDLQMSFVPPAAPAMTGPEATVEERFDAGFDGSAGDLWSGPWVELDPEKVGSSKGSVRIAGKRLRLDDRPDSGTEPSLSRRAVAPSGAELASIAFDWETSSGVDREDAAGLQISTDGGATFTTLREITGLEGRNVGSEVVELPESASSEVVVRFAVLNLYGGSDEYFYVDDVVVKAVADVVATPTPGGDDAGSSEDSSDDVETPTPETSSAALLPCDITQDPNSWWYNPYTCFPSLIGADRVHDAGITGRGVTIAFLDTGLFSHYNILYGADGHYRLRSQYDAQRDYEYRWDFVPSDAHGHGGHVASVALSSVLADNGRYNGVAPDADVVSIKAFGSSGSGSYADVIRGIGWAVENKDRYGIDVLNLSISADARSRYWDDPLNQAVMAAWEAGIVVVASAGNT